MDATFFDAVRESVFGGTMSQPQVDGINTIAEAWKRYGDGDNRKLAYLLGTTFHETARTMQPVRETLAKTDAKAKELLTKAWKSGRLKVSKDYWSGGYFGRGYVQLTHKENYERAGKELGVDLVGNPSLAMDPAIAAAVLIKGCMEGWFTTRKLSTYINQGGADYINARRVVNGTDRAELIATYATSFYRALAAAKEAPKPSPAPTPAAKAETPASKPHTIPNEVIAAVAALVLALIAAVLSGAWKWVAKVVRPSMSDVILWLLLAAVAVTLVYSLM